MTLRVTFEVGRLDILDTALIDFARCDVPMLDKFAEPCRRFRIVFIVVGMTHFLLLALRLSARANSFATRRGMRATFEPLGGFQPCAIARIVRRCFADLLGMSVLRLFTRHFDDDLRHGIFGLRPVVLRDELGRQPFDAIDNNLGRLRIDFVVLELLDDGHHVLDE